MRRAVTAVLLLTLGAAAGWVGRGFWSHAGTRAVLVERRAGGYRHVNPLLACDLGGEMADDRGELRPFREKVASHLAGKGWTGVSVYFRELNDGPWFSIGETERFVPASLRKLPMLLAVLKMVERAPGANLLGRTVKADLGADYNARQNIRPSQELVRGQSYTVLELIRRMIVYSDNNAFMLLSGLVDPAELSAVYATLELPAPAAVGDAQFHPVQTYASLFRILFNATYLSREPSDWALELLTQTEFRSGLVAGVPPDVEVAHKFGEHSDGAGTVQLHDCGIVYFPQHPYVLCVMSRGPSFEILDDAIADVSQVVYEEVARQHGAH